MENLQTWDERMQMEVDELKALLTANRSLERVCDVGAFERKKA